MYVILKGNMRRCKFVNNVKHNHVAPNSYVHIACRQKNLLFENDGLSTYSAPRATIRVTIYARLLMEYKQHLFERSTYQSLTALQKCSKTAVTVL